MRRNLLAIALALSACGSDSSSGGGSGGTSTAGGSGGSVHSGGSGGTVAPDASLGGSSGSTAGGAGGGSGNPGAELGTFQLTYYWVTLESEYTGTKDTQLFDSSCNLLATVTAKFAASLKLEGTGKLEDGRLL